MPGEAMGDASIAEIADIVERLGALFAKCDTHGDGSASPSDLLNACRSDEKVALFWGADRTCSELERALAASGGGPLSWRDFLNLHLRSRQVPDHLRRVVSNEGPVCTPSPQAPDQQMGGVPRWAASTSPAGSATIYGASQNGSAVTYTHQGPPGAVAEAAVVTQTSVAPMDGVAAATKLQSYVVPRAATPPAMPCEPSRRSTYARAPAEDRTRRRLSPMLRR